MHHEGAVLEHSVETPIPHQIGFKQFDSGKHVLQMSHFAGIFEASYGSSNLIPTFNELSYNVAGEKAGCSCHCNDWGWSFIRVERH